MKKIFLFFLLVALMLIPSVSASINWVDNSTQLTKGLANITSACQCWVDPTIFYKDGVWTAIASGGDTPYPAPSVSEYFGYTWNGTEWVSNSSVITGLPSIDHYISPAVFQINGVWVLVRGRWGDTGIPAGYTWNGNSWVFSPSFSSGLSPLSEGKPTIFQMTSGEYVLIMEHAYSGIYTGYTWTGSSWLYNASLVSGLEGLGTYSHPAAFVKDGENLLIISQANSSWTAGHGPDYVADFSFLGFKWNGTKWISDPSQVIGLEDTGFHYTLHTVFQKDGKWILIGTRDGTVNYFGFESVSDDEGPITSNVIASPNPIEMNGDVILNAIVDDTTTGGSNIESAEYSFDGGINWNSMSAKDALNSATEEVTATFSIPNSNVYNLCVRGTDAVGNTGNEKCILLVVYDSNGMTAGGGWYYPLNDAESSMSGTASFGFITKYIKNSATGNLEFQYNIDDKLDLKSTSITWLTVSGTNAQFKGTATLNGEPEFYFRVKAEDKGEPGTGVDRFSIMIWNGNPDIDTSTLVHSSHNTLAGGNIIVRTKNK